MRGNEVSKELSPEVCICAMCGSKSISTKEEDYVFPYGKEEKSVQITAHVPVKYCAECGFNWLDNKSQELCHEAVCRYEGVMTPAEIKNLRKQYGLTQAQFSQITKIGGATLSRWERGLLIQNEAYDNYLYLIKLPFNLERLRKRNKPSGENIQLESVQSRFRSLQITDEIRKKQAAFKLHPQNDIRETALCM